MAAKNVEHAGMCITISHTTNNYLDFSIFLIALFKTLIIAVSLRCFFFKILNISFVSSFEVALII